LQDAGGNDFAFGHRASGGGLCWFLRQQDSAKRDRDKARPKNVFARAQFSVWLRQRLNRVATAIDNLLDAAASPKMETIHAHHPAAGAGRTELSVSGMTCSGCARTVTEAIQSVAGVASASVSLEQKHASVRWTAGAQTDVEAVLRAIETAGYEAESVEPATAGSHDHSGAHGLWGTSVLTGIVPTALLMAGEWVFRLGEQGWFRWVSFALAAIVQFGPGRHFYRGAWNQLKAGASNMDTLVALGSTTAFGYSVWALLSGAGGHLYFMEAAAIITLISIGHWMEARVSARASSSLKALMNLAPSLARRRNADGSETDVPVAELQLGDVVALKPGDRVPTDGEVIEGSSAVDESMLTGESLPMDKAPSAKLYAGTVNLNGRLLMRVTSVGEDTALAHIIAAVQRAQNSRANIQRLGDRVSSVFVPVVVLVAIAAGLWWGLMPEQAHRVSQWLSGYLWTAHPPASALAAGLITAAAVLIIACPCAMGLATPAAIMASANVAARRGILIRDGVALEKAGLVTAVLFDKTGTLTAGKPSVVQVESFSGDKTKATDLAASLAGHSNHPLSQAVARLGRGEVELADWEEIRGAGVQAKRRAENGAMKVVRLGSLRWLGESGADLSAGKAFVEQWSTHGATILGLAQEHSLLALVALKDTVKPGASDVVGQLQRQGIGVYLVTGDNALTAASLAKQAGIAVENVFAEVRPEKKAELVKKLQREGQRVAFVGDGINDAPALEQADLGIAVSRASDIAREAADIILLKSEIEAVPESLGLARATLRTIKQNLFWAFFYNALGVPLAALGFMSPVLCAAAMGVSDLVVIGNALRLRRWSG
jgi:Cu+-exporting ATPase